MTLLGQPVCNILAMLYRNTLFHIYVIPHWLFGPLTFSKDLYSKEQK